MSFVVKESVEVIAQCIGITNLSPEVAEALGPDVEYRIREIIQEAVKCMRHSKRTVLTGDDVDSALRLRNVEPTYGFTSNDAPRFKRAAGHKDLFYIDEKDLEFKDVMDAPLPRAPPETSVIAHWLAVEGVQPAIPENPPVEASEGTRFEYKDDGISADGSLSVKHVVTKELQLYYEKVRELAFKKPNSMIFKEALQSLATDSGLQPLVPFFVSSIADEVSKNLTKIQLLFALVRVVRSLLHNPHIHIEPYLHQLMPSLVTCVVTRQLGNHVSDNHWELRNMSASSMASICKRYGHAYQNLQPRVVRTLLHAFLDPNNSLPQHYGAVRGLAGLGPTAVRMFILPNLEPYMQLIKAEIAHDNLKNYSKKLEAWRVYRALMCAAGMCMYERLKLLPNLFSPPSRAIWKNTRKVATVLPNKRRASSDNLLPQPPQKKPAIEANPMVRPMGGSMQMSHMPMSSMQVAGASGTMTNPGVMGMGRLVHHEGVQGRDPRNLAARSSSVLAQAWKETVNAGQVLESLFDHFGESMFCFTVKPELSIFL
ncbi:hypothetical protein MLD38_035317 [Melastoma candidum]|uniref:Uncharacterized protein n=1 Tax=Melastoma candidum TaxID=119954 RepID=A0ACB9MEU9_9MYRT|nr:hypothetical protein MLD38_035317 [Melastoma candidum]